MDSALTSPSISVVIPTLNRAGLLDQTLDSLGKQSLSRHQYEVIVVDDGSSDTTPNVCRRHSSKVALRYFRLMHSGTSAAKNLGIMTAASPIVLFFDDDDLADSDLLKEHLEGHQKHPEDNFAILGYTAWAPRLQVTEVMDYILNVSHRLFNYSRLNDGQELDFTYFWAGRISCKRAFLARRGIFDQRLQAAAHEDVELGYRLSRFGLKVIFRRSAVQYMNRPITYAEYCQRCEKQGQAQWAIRQLYSEEVIREHWKSWVVIGAEENWREGAAALGQKVGKVEEIEARLASSPAAQERDALVKELRRLYNWTFKFFKIQGVIKAMRAEALLSAPSTYSVAITPDGDGRGEKDEPATRKRARSDSAVPIVIGGCLRSGTTLLHRVLNAHSRIFCAPEVKFFRDFHSNYVKDPLRHVRFMNSARALAPEAELLELAGKAFITLQERAATRAGKPRWADKNPENVIYLDDWARLLGEAWVFVHVVRHPLDTLASMKEANFPFTIPPSLGQRIGMYKRYLLAGLDFARAHPERYYRVHYEKFVRAPETVIGDLMTWLGETFEPRQLDLKNSARELGYGTTIYQRGLEDPKLAAESAIHSRSVGRWPTLLTNDEAQQVWQATRELWRVIEPDAPDVCLPEGNSPAARNGA